MVTKLHEQHCNHAVDESLTSHYPEFKRPSKETIDKTNDLFEYKAKTHRIRQMVMSTGVKTSAQDKQNLR